MKFDHLLSVASALLFLAPSWVAQSVPNLPNQTPLAFEPNLGQHSPDVSYSASHPGYRISINQSSFSLAIPVAQSKSGLTQTRLLKLRWGGDHSAALWRPGTLQPGKSNYFIGRDASRWVTKVPHYAEVSEIDAMPGVDIRYHASSENELEYDLIVAPGTDAASLRLTVEGADSLRICQNGALCITVAGIEMRQLVPHAYEWQGERKVPLPVACKLTRYNEVSFAVSGRTAGSQLIIDPVLQYATYLGGKTGILNFLPYSQGMGTAVDSLGNMFIMGRTLSTDFPTTNNAYQDSLAAAYPSFFVTKLSASGQLLYSTYLSGRNGVDAVAVGGKMIAVDGNGYAYITGGAFNDFPTTQNGYQQECGYLTAYTCAFLTKLNQDGSELLYSTMLGQGPAAGTGVVVGQNGDAYISGWVNSWIPTTPGAFETTCPVNTDFNCSSGFAARFDTTSAPGRSLVFSTYLGTNGAPGDSDAVAIAVDKFGDAYVAVNTSVYWVGFTAYSGMGEGPILNRDGDPYSYPPLVILVKLSGTDGHPLRAGTRLFGASATSLVVDNDLNMYLAGAASWSLGVTPGAFQKTFGGGAMDGFVAKIDYAGYFVYTTFLGGAGQDVVEDIALNDLGMAFVTGTTNSSNFPLGPGAFKTGHSRPTSFVAALNPNGGSLYYSSYLGGNTGSTSSRSIAVDEAGNAYVAGVTSDTDFPVTPGAVQSTRAGTTDAFLAKVIMAADLRATVLPLPASTPRNGVVIYHARLTNFGPDESDNVVFTDVIPAGMAYEGVYVPSGNGCSQPSTGATTGTLTCRKTRLQRGETFYVNVYLRAVGKSGSTVTNRMRGSAQTQDLWPNNNSVAAVVKIQ